MIDPIGEAVLAALAEGVTSGLVNAIKGQPPPGHVRTYSPEKAVTKHLQMIDRWSSEVSFKDLTQPRSLDASYVDLTCSLGIGRAASVHGMTLKASSLYDFREHVILLGDPGAGKTTTLKRIVRNALLHGRKPLVVRLADIAPASSLAVHLLLDLGVLSGELSDFTVDAKRGETGAALQAWARKVVGDALEGSVDLLVADGLDEVKPEAMPAVVQDLRHLFLGCGSTRVMATCRIGAFVFSFERTQPVTLLPLSPPQVRRLADRWLGSDAPRFTAQLSNTPYAGTEVLPLTLVHLLVLFQRHGQVPPRPRTVYRKIVRLALEEWDEQRSIPHRSGYAMFDADRKEDFLRRFAFHLAVTWGRHNFSTGELRAAYRDLHADFGLSEYDATKVVREIESHTGLIVELGQDQYEFAHRSLCEYLAASHLVTGAALPMAHVLLRLPNELAVATALSSQPTAFLQAIVDGLAIDTTEWFWQRFADRLAIEKPDFSLSAVLGASIGLLLDRLRPDDVAASLGERLLALPQVQPSLHLFLSECDTRGGNGNRIELVPERWLSANAFAGYPPSIWVPRAVVEAR